MSDNAELTDLIERLGVVIKETCNTLGCKECDLKWDGSCSANELQGKIQTIEMKEYEESRANYLSGGLTH